MKSGIYQILNRTTGKFYIGQSNNVPRRWMEHKAPGRKRATVLNRAFKKYGIGSFDFILLETCTADKLDEREQYYIESLKPAYNMNNGGPGNGGHIVTDEVKSILSSRAKNQWKTMSAEKKARIKSNLSPAKIGHLVSKETREKLRNANKGKKLTDEHCKKIGRANKKAMAGNTSGNKPVVCIDKASHRIAQWFPSTKVAALNFGVTPSVITGVLRGRRKSTCGYYWEYADHVV